MAGWIGGSAGIVVGHPADTVKVVQQVFAIKECLPAELRVEDTWCLVLLDFYITSLQTSITCGVIDDHSKSFKAID